MHIPAKLTQEAQKDLDNIENYIIETFKSPLTAIDVLNLIFDEIEILESNPMMGIDLQDYLKYYDRQLVGRRIILNPYKIIYKINNDIIWIQRIFNSKQEIIPRTLY
jgi:plasmid stabilization system protein ParE